MMLASPLLPSAPFSPKVASAAPEDPLAFRPARDVEAFNSLLPPPIEFVEGSSSGALAVPEGKYQPINVSPKLSTKDRPDGPSLRPRTPVTPTTPAPASSASLSTPSGAKNAAASSSLGLGVDLSWPETCDRASGLYNTGNTCFLNSALQCLLHTPPLLRVVIAHGKDQCHTGDKFCMVCAFRQVTVQAHKSTSPITPQAVSSRLQTIAKHMRRGRQEDAHEFLRYAIDAMQKAYLHGVPPKREAKLADTTWVHKIFGGKLRSRVSCQGCGHNSDTFDRILDLSLDIIKADSLKEALKSFISPDYLKGADKYKCEKCKKHVNAEKRFTIHEAPPVLTVHLKRFSPLGRKIGHHVTYDEHLNLQPYMSKDQFGPMYTLYGIICHAGSGPNSGHYYAYVKSRLGKWHEMNDETVSSMSGPPVNKKMAYILFYLRDKGQGMQVALKSGGGGGVNGVQKERVVAGMKKKRERDEDEDSEEGEKEEEEEDVGEKVGAGVASGKKFIGPLLPSPMTKSSGSPTKKVKYNHPERSDREGKSDPQAERVKQRIQAAKEVKEAKAKKALAVLDGYGSGSGSSSENDEEKDVDMEKKQSDKSKGREKGKAKGKGEAVVGTDTEEEEEEAATPPARTSSPEQHVKHSLPTSSPIPSNSFYGPSSSKPRLNGNGSSTSSRKRRSDEEEDDDDDDDDKSSQNNKSPYRQRNGDHNHRQHNKKQKRFEKRRMSMESGTRGRGQSQSKGYVNPFSRIGSENSTASKNGADGGGGRGGGRMNTYGRRNRWRPRVL